MSEGQNMTHQFYSTPLPTPKSACCWAFAANATQGREGAGARGWQGQGFCEKDLEGQNASLIKSSLKESFKQNRASGLAACPFLLRVQMVPGNGV